MAYGRRRLLRVGGVRLLVPARGGLLEPSSVSLVHRTPTGPVRVVSHVPFATRPALQAAARAHGVCPEVAVGLVAAVVAQLGLHHVPTGAVVRGHLQGRTWEAMRLVEVVPRVGRPEQQIHLSDARHLIETVALGEQVGVSLPREDWLTPLLHWVARPG